MALAGLIVAVALTSAAPGSAAGEQPSTVQAVYRLKAARSQVSIRIAVANVVNGLIETLDDPESTLPTMPHELAQLRAERAATVIEVTELSERSQDLATPSTDDPEWDDEISTAIQGQIGRLVGDQAVRARSQLKAMLTLEVEIHRRVELLKLCNTSLSDAILDLPNGGAVADVLVALRMLEVQESQLIDRQLEHELGLIALEQLLGLPHRRYAPTAAPRFLGGPTAVLDPIGAYWPVSSLGAWHIGCSVLEGNDLR